MLKPATPQLYASGALLGLGLAAALWPPGILLWKALAAALLVIGLGDLYRLYRLPQPLVERRVRGSVPVGVWTPVELQLANPSTQPLRLLAHDHHPADFEIEGQPRALWLPALRRLTLRYRVRPRQRGDGSFTALELLFFSPLGFWTRRRMLPLPQRVRVFPNFRQIARYALLATDHQLSQMGIRRRPRRGEGNDFHQLREYRNGDSLRQIDWKASSRHRRLISKEYQDERDQQLLFLLDCGRHMRHADAAGAHLDHALNAMLLLSYVAARQGDAVGFMTFGGPGRWQPPRKGGDLIRRLLERTYDLESTLQGSDYLAAARTLLSLQRRRAMIVILTNSHEEDQADLTRAVRLLARRHLVVLAQLREQALDAVLAQGVDDLEAALRFQAVVDYLYARRQGHEALRHQGAVLLDVVPARLPVALVNRYLEIKASGAL